VILFAARIYIEFSQAWEPRSNLVTRSYTLMLTK